MKFWKKHSFGIIYGFILVGFTVYAALDVFVIPHPQAVVEVPVSDYYNSYSEVEQTAVINNSSSDKGLDTAKSIEKEDSLNGKVQGENTSEDNVDLGLEGETESDDATMDGTTAEKTSDKTSTEKATSDKSTTDKSTTDKSTIDETITKDELTDESITDESVKNESATDETTEGETKVDENAVDETSGEEDQPIVNSMNPVANIGSYSDGNITISVSQYRNYDTDLYVADVKLTDASLLKTAFADNVYGRNIKARTSKIASDHNAILAINGDFYGARLTGYVIRNGVLYRNEPTPGNQDLAIYGDGSFSIVSENDHTAEELLETGAIQVISFGPGLVGGGSILVNENTEVAVASPSNPRSAIGRISGLHYVFVCSDGRTKESAGLSLLQLAEFMQNLGVKTGYNLDGGGSSAIYFNGKILNKPTTDGKKIEERTVSDIVYIGY